MAALRTPLALAAMLTLPFAALGGRPFPLSAPSVEGTEWSGDDTPLNIRTVFRFEKGGALEYAYNGSTYRTGSWRQEGAKVYFELNSRYRECEATVRGDVLEGDSWNARGLRWKTTLRRTAKGP